MEILISNLVSGLVGLIFGVVLEKPLIRFRDYFVGVITKPFKKTIPLRSPFHFSFGSIETTEVTVDGDGQAEYTPSTIICHYDPTPIVLPPELQAIKDKIEKEEVRKRDAGEPHMWNGPTYALQRYTRARTDNEDHLVVHLFFRPTDYFTYWATNVSLDTEYVIDDETGQPVTLRAKYFRDVDWSSPSLQPVPYFGNTFGMNACLISNDERILLIRRSREVSHWRGLYHIAINESLQRPIDRSDYDDAPNPYRALIRGAAEEIGIEVNPSEITLLTLTVTSTYSSWGMHGLVRSSRSMQEIINSRTIGARDKWEGTELIPIEFSAKAVVEFVHSHTPWSPHGLACLYLTLVHEFGKRTVEEAIRKYMS